VDLKRSWCTAGLSRCARCSGDLRAAARFPRSCLITAAAAPEKNWNGSDPTTDRLTYSDQYSLVMAICFLFLFRRGFGLSADQGTSAIDLMNSELAARGQKARNALQLRLLENREMTDADAGLAFLRALPEVDTRKVAIVGHSFGGSLTILQSEREPNLRAVVIFSAAGYSWDRSPELRARLLTAVAHIRAPAFFIHAANDYSVNPGKALDTRLEQLGKPHRLKIYSVIGRTPDDGHAFPFLGVSIWEPDVFAFLGEHMQM
jgi:carboxymethylenebutenolidase